MRKTDKEGEDTVPVREVVKISVEIKKKKKMKKPIRKCWKIGEVCGWPAINQIRLSEADILNERQTHNKIG